MTFYSLAKIFNAHMFCLGDQTIVKRHKVRKTLLCLTVRGSV